MKGRRTCFADLLDENRARERKKLLAKLPLWSRCEGIRIPQSLALEQCSSSYTADFKANYLNITLPVTERLADLTGGFGVDTWSFAQVFSYVDYFEQNEELCNIAKENFKSLSRFYGVDSNITTHCCCVTSDTIKHLAAVDCIFIDPARRSKTGSKVFLIEECYPNILELLPEIAKKSEFLMVKFSPMADLSMLHDRLSKALSDLDYNLLSIGVIGVKHEVKEILTLMGKFKVNTPYLYLKDAFIPDGNLLELPKDKPITKYSTSFNGTYLLEPDAMILKSGYQDMCCELWDAEKVSSGCHLYFSRALESGAFSQHYKAFEICEIRPFNKKEMLETSHKYPISEVSVKGLPLGSAELALRMGIKSGIAPDGNHYHIFAIGTPINKLLLITKSIYSGSTSIR